MEMFETVREFNKRFQDLETQEKRRLQLRFRNMMATYWLRLELQPGDQLRATAARCMAHEATFLFSKWDHNWIVSKSGVSIAPGSVYSINGAVMKLPVCPDGWIDHPKIVMPRRGPGTVYIPCYDPSDEDTELPF